MLIAYNNDIEYKSRWYHIQTEDNGIKDGHITTTVFYSGQILDSKTTSYLEAIASITDEEQRNAAIKSLMQKQHQLYYSRLMEGTYDSQMEALTQKHDSSVSPSKVSNLGHSLTSSRVDTATFNNAKKPDILRASQQLAGISKNSVLGMGNKQAESQPRVRILSSQNRLPTSTLAPNSEIPRSKAVEAEIKLATPKAWRGVSWGKADLALDVLVASLLEKQR